MLVLLHQQFSQICRHAQDRGATAGGTIFLLHCLLCFLETSSWLNC